MELAISTTTEPIDLVVVWGGPFRSYQQLCLRPDASFLQACRVG